MRNNINRSVSAVLISSQKSLDLLIEEFVCPCSTALSSHSSILLIFTAIRALHYLIRILAITFSLRVPSFKECSQGPSVYGSHFLEVLSFHVVVVKRKIRPLAESQLFVEEPKVVKLAEATEIVHHLSYLIILLLRIYGLLRVGES